MEPYSNVCDCMYNCVYYITLRIMGYCYTNQPVKCELLLRVIAPQPQPDRAVHFREYALDFSNYPNYTLMRYICWFTHTHDNPIDQKKPRQRRMTDTMCICLYVFVSSANYCTGILSLCSWHWNYVQHMLSGHSVCVCPWTHSQQCARVQQRLHFPHSPHHSNYIIIKVIIPSVGFREHPSICHIFVLLFGWSNPH